VSVRAGLVIQHPMRMRQTAICGLPRSTIFFRIIYKWQDIQKKNYWTQNYDFLFSVQFFVGNISHSKKN
jgi:hypothetical protein